MCCIGESFGGCLRWASYINMAHWAERGFDRLSGYSMDKRYRIAVIPGDGIGKEVVPEGLRALETAGRRFGIAFDWDELPWSCDYYAKHGRMMSEDWFERIRHHDAL